MDKNYEKRMLLLLVLSFVMVVGTMFFFNKKGSTIPPKPANTNAAAQASASAGSNGTAQSVLLAVNTNVTYQNKAKATNITLSFDKELFVNVDTYGARVTGISIDGKWNRYKTPVSLVATNAPYLPGDISFGDLESLRGDTNRPVYTIVESSVSNVVLKATVTYEKKSIDITKSYTLDKNYQIHEEIAFSSQNKSEVVFDINGKSVSLGASFSFFSPEKANSGNIMQDRYYDGKKIQNALQSHMIFGAPDNVTSIQNPGWLSVNDNYFIATIKPEFSPVNGKYLSLTRVKTYTETALGLEFPLFSLKNGETKSYKVSFYIGPKKEALLTKIDKSYGKLFEWWPVFNWFMIWIVRFVEFLMAILSVPISNWGVIILLLAIIIKLILSPLSINAAASIKKANQLQPKIKNLQEKYKGDQKVFNEKMAELYKKEGVNPLGGCLPILLQLPVFFAFFRVIGSSVELRGASFLWIKDLTQSDTLFTFPSVFFLPFLQNFHFNLLPIFMTGIQMVQMKMQSMKNPANTQQQAFMNTYILPLVFLFIFWSMPSGLVLYWTVQSLYSIIEQEVINLDRYVKVK